MSQLPDCTPLGALFGQMGATLALAFANFGAAYGTVKSGVALAHLGMTNKSRTMRGMVPVIMAGILGIYGLIVAVIVSSNVKQGSQYTLSAGLMHLGAGVTGGLSSLAAGFAIGMVGDACCAAYQRTESIFVAMILILIFAEALGLYGMIISLLMNSTASSVKGECSLAQWTHVK